MLSAHTLWKKSCHDDVSSFSASLSWRPRDEDVRAATAGAQWWGQWRGRRHREGERWRLLGPAPWAIRITKASGPSDVYSPSARGS
jgi:hypothetical protein